MPYGDSSCEVLANGAANYLKIPYHPLENNPMSLHALWATSNEIKWTPITQENLMDKEFLCVKNTHTHILEHKETQLINTLNKYYGLINNVQNIFHTNYFDLIVTSVKNTCFPMHDDVMESAT